MNKSIAQRALDALKKSLVFSCAGDWDETYKAHHAAIAELEAVIAQPVEQFKGPAKWAPEEVDRGNCGIRWVNEEGVQGRPTECDVREYLQSTPTATGCGCAKCLAFYKPAAPGWLPISQAPKDGTQYLAYSPSHGRFIENQPPMHYPGEWVQDAGCRNGWSGHAHQDDRKATLFQHLPGEPT